MTILSAAYQTAVQHHQSGELQQAEQIYRQILRTDPRHAPALHMLGALALQRGQYEQAIACISAAIRIDGNQAIYHKNLGEAYRASGKRDDARVCYLRAIALDPRPPQPHLFLALLHLVAREWAAARDRCKLALARKADYAEAHAALGNALQQLGDSPAAEACFERALAIQPNYVEAMLGLAVLLHDSKQVERARARLQRAVELRPQDPDAWLLLGNVELGRENWAAAEKCYGQAILQNPRLALAECRLGGALAAQKRRDEADAHYKRAVELAPGLAEAHYGWGVNFAKQHRAAEAIECHRKVLAIEPDHPGAHLTLGADKQKQGLFAEALSHYDRVLASQADSVDAHFNRAFILLAQGDLAAGWAEYAWRMKVPDFSVQVLKEPLWDGSPLADKTLLVHAEQGMGDTLHFLRYLSLVKQRCARVVLEVQAPLVQLLEQAGFGNVVGRNDQLPPFDCQIPLLSLPGVLGTTLGDIPAEVPYLSVRAEGVARWRARLQPIAGFRIGIAWQGNPNNEHDATRSIPLAQFEPLSRVEYVTLISLQKQDGGGQLADINFTVRQIEGEWDELAGPFVDSAAIMKNLDLVITADTASAHLAGALGVPVWLALSYQADWRWMLERADSPWYPTMRLLRQRVAGDWSEVFARMAEELKQLPIAH